MRKICDERLLMISKSILGKSYFVFLSMIILGGIIKYLTGERSIDCYYLEAVSLLGSMGYIIYYHARLGIPLVGGMDEYRLQECRKARARGFMFCFWTYVFGNLYYLIADRNMFVMTVNLIVWFVVDIIVVIMMLRRGVLAPEVVLGKKEKDVEDQFLKLKRSSIGGGLLFGGGMAWSVGSNQAFSDSLMVRIAGYATVWILAGAFFGIFWYFAMKMVMIWSDKKSNRKPGENDEG